MRADIFVLVTLRQDQQQAFTYLHRAPAFRTREQGRLESVKCSPSLLRHNKAKINRRHGLRKYHPQGPARDGSDDARIIFAERVVYFASWKMIPSAARRPVRIGLTPCFTLTR